MQDIHTFLDKGQVLQAEAAKNPAAAGAAGGAKVKEIAAAFTANVWEVLCKPGAQVPLSPSFPLGLHYRVGAYIAAGSWEVHDSTRAEWHGNFSEYLDSTAMVWKHAYLIQDLD